MSNKKRKKMLNSLGDTLLIGGTLIICGSIICYLLPGVATFILNVLKTIIKLSLMSSGAFIFVLSVGFITKGIRIEQVNKNKHSETKNQTKRQQLHVVKQEELTKEKTEENREETPKKNENTYLFDNNYTDAPYEDAIIDDMQDLDLTPISGYSRKRCRYKGKYIK